MEGTGEGCGFFVLRSRPIYVQCLNNFVADCSSSDFAILVIYTLLKTCINSTIKCQMAMAYKGLLVELPLFGTYWF